MQAAPAHPADRVRFDMRRRVCLVTDSRDPSGVGAHMLALGAELARDHHVVLAADPSTGLLARAAAHGLAIRAFDPDDPAGFGLWLARAGIDLLHVQAGIGWEGHALAGIGRAAGVRTILRTEHLPDLVTDPAERAAQAAGLAQVDGLICVSAAAADTYRPLCRPGLPIAIVENGVTPAAATRMPADTRAALGLPAAAPILLMAARFTAQKRHRLLLAALPAVLAAHPDTFVLLAGDGELRPKIEAEIAAHGLASRIRCLGHRDDLPDLMAAADLVVLPSAFEGLPLVVLEAMAAGRPVVATRVPGSEAAVVDGLTGWLVPPDDPARLAGVLIRALADPAARAAAGEAGQARFRTRYRADRMARDTTTIYRAFTAPTATQEGDDVDKVRIGFIGAGGIAQRHLGQLETFADVEIAAFADTDLGRATDAAARFGARAFADHDAMLAEVELDAVYVCVPPFAHGAPERAAIARGLPIFVEKPVSLDLATAEEIAALIRERDLVSAVGYHWRYLDTVDEARRLLRDNPAQLLSGYWLDSTPPPRWWWRLEGSGGQMLEQTTHLLDLARFLVGEVTQVYGMAGHKDRAEFPDLDVPTVSTASLTFASGAVANFASTCLLKWNHRVGLNVFADGLAIELSDRDIMVDVGRGRPVRGADGDPVWREDRAFVDAVLGRENRIRCTYADALRSHRLAHAVAESARTGAAIPMPAEPEGTVRPEPAPLIDPPRPPAPGPAPGHRHVRSFGVERPGEPYIWGYDEGPPGDGRVRLDTLFTGFSAGTELTFVKNTNPYLHSRWDAGRGVFVPGEAGMHYPVPFLGYMEVARVSEARAPGFAVGDVVGTTFGHKTGHTADPFNELLVTLPAGLDPMLGIYVAQMGPIAANGILHADAEFLGPNVTALGQGLVGRPTLVIGAGIVGLLTALFAARAGATEVVIADPSPFRRERAAALGLRAMPEADAWAYAKANWHHGGSDRGADVVFQTRADSGSLNAALQALRPQGVVIDLAFYQGGADRLRLGEEFHHNGLAIRCAQINRVPRGLGTTWTRRRLSHETIGLLTARGADVAAHMITHVVPYDEAPAFVRHLVADRPDFLQIVFRVDA